MSDEAGEPDSRDEAADDRVVVASLAGASDLLTRGGKVAPAAVRAAVARAQAANYYNVTIPALFVFSDDDQIVDHTMTRAIEEKWAGPTTIINVDDADDAQNHVIAGDAMSPSTTERLADEVVAWVKRAFDV